MHKFKNQKGFAIFELLFFLLLGVILIGAAFYVGKHSGSKSKTESSQSTTSIIGSTSKVQPVSPTVDTAAQKEAKLQTFLIKTCNSKDGPAINAMFANQASQSVDSDNFKISGDYAVVNVSCTLTNGTQLSTLFAKYSSGNWTLVTQSPEVGCQYLTDQGFPDDLKAPFCQNQEGSFGG